MKVADEGAARARERPRQKSPLVPQAWQITHLKHALARSQISKATTIHSGTGNRRSSIAAYPPLPAALAPLQLESHHTSSGPIRLGRMMQPVNPTIHMTQVSMLPADASIAPGHFMQPQPQQSKAAGPTAAAGHHPCPQRQSSVGSHAVVTTEVRTNAPEAPGGAQAANYSNPSMLSTDAPMIDYGHHVTVTVTYHSQTLPARSHEQMSIDACETLCTEGRSSRPQVPPLPVAAHAEARLPNGDFLSSGSLSDLRDLIASAAAEGDMTEVQDDVQVPLVLPTTAASPRTSDGLSSMILDELVLPKSPSHELPCCDLLVQQQQQQQQLADVNLAVNCAPTNVPALSAASAVSLQPQLQRETQNAYTSAPYITPCLAYTMSGSALNDGSTASTPALAHALAATKVPAMQLDMDTACQSAVIMASRLSDVAIPVRGAAAAAAGRFGDAYQPHDTSSYRPVNDVAAMTQLGLPQLLPHSDVFRPSAHQQLLQQWGHQVATAGALMNGSSIPIHNNAFSVSMEAAHDTYANIDAFTASGGSETLAQQQLLLSHDDLSEDIAQLVCDEIDVLQQPRPAFGVNAMQCVSCLPGVHMKKSTGAVCDDISGSSLSRSSCHAGYEVVRHARLITCKTYLRHLDITQAMADDLLPHHHMQFPVEVSHSQTLATAGFGGEIPMTPLCQANSGCTVLQKKNITLMYTSGAKFGVQYEVVSCNTQKHLRFNKGWRTFTRVQGIQVGDTIVFERRGDTSSTLYVGVVKGDSSPLNHALGYSQQQQQQQQQVPADAQEPPNRKRRYA